MTKNNIYTIGYTLFQRGSNFDLEGMYKTLHQFGVTHLVDVRSVPFSKQYPLCNEGSLKMAGKTYGIPYIHMPELGAKALPDQDVFSKASDIFFEDIFPIPKSNRPERTELNANDEIVDFTKFRNNELLLDGLKRIENAYDKGFTLALMCSEKNPIDCHRFFLVSKKIEQQFGTWLEVKHIVSNSIGEITTQTNSALNKMLADIILNKTEIKKLDILNSSLFGDQPVIENYYGNNREEKITDFCDRYWNLMHGWKKTYNTNVNDYD